MENVENRVKDVSQPDHHFPEVFFISVSRFPVHIQTDPRGPARSSTVYGYLSTEREFPVRDDMAPRGLQSSL